MKTPEGYEKDDICKYLDGLQRWLAGCWYFKPQSAGYGKSGVGDIVACIDGIFWNVEVKREGKEPTALQNQRMAEVVNAGGMVAWGTAEKVIAEIELWRQRKRPTP